MSLASKIDQEKYRLIVENSNDLIQTLDLEGNFTYVSPSFERVLGYKPVEVLGVNSISFIHPEDQKRALDAFILILNGQQSSLHQFRAKHKNGSWRYIEATEASVVDQNKQPFMFVAITRDITDRIEFERRKDEFVSILSHELKTPLTSINGLVDILQKQSQLQEILSLAYIEKLSHQIGVLTERVDTLVDVSELQIGSFNLQKEKFLLNKLVAEVVKSYSKKIKHLISVKAKSDVTIYADKRRIAAVLNALLSNAVKYSSSKKPINIEVSKTDKEALVSVQDFGIGIPKSEQSKVFMKFHQIGNQTAYLSPGFGLGLYFAREIIYLHFGDIWVESKKNEGSSFFFTLPLNNSQ